MKEFYLPDWKLEEWRGMAYGTFEEQVHRLECIADWFAGFTENETNWHDLRALRHMFNALRCNCRDCENVPGWRRDTFMLLYKQLFQICVEEFPDEWSKVDRI